MGLDEADDDVGAAAVATPALVEHGEGLAHPGDRAHVDTEPTRGADGVGLDAIRRVDRTGLGHRPIVPAAGGRLEERPAGIVERTRDTR